MRKFRHRKWKNLDRTIKSRSETQIQVNLGGHDLSSGQVPVWKWRLNEECKNGRQRRRWGQFSGHSSLLLGCLYKPLFFSPFQTSIIAFFTKTQTSQKFWDKSLSFPLFTQNICCLLRNVHYSHSFVQINFHLFYSIYSRLTLHHHSPQNHFIFAWRRGWGFGSEQ